MTPLQRYQEVLKQPDFEPDPSQAAVVEILQHSYLQLLNNQDSSLPNGLYLWGRVGRGKSFLMDLFYQSITHQCKKRIHFHRFMKDIHRQLSQHQGEFEPLIAIADMLADEVKVLCFDEFFVNDIGDAMLLSGLIRQLFKRGVLIVATSNVEPTQLYKNGLQRQRFIPAIQAIEANMQVVHMDGLVDHRLRTLIQSQAYFLLDQPSSRQLMFECFDKTRVVSAIMFDIVLPGTLYRMIGRGDLSAKYS